MIFKKLTAAALAFVITLGVLPPVSVSANPQLPVTDMWIEVPVQPATPGLYNLNLFWSRPAESFQPQPGRTIQNDDYRATSYELLFRNATTGPGFNYAAPQFTIDSEAEDISHTITNQTFTPSSVYSFQSIPWHMEDVWTPVPPPPPGVFTWVRQRALQTLMPLTAHRQVLFMTDIEVVSSEGGTDEDGNPTITVTWNNPTFDGGDIFTGYRIYYRLRGAAPLPALNRVTDPHINVAIGTPTRVGNQMTYTFTSPAIVEGMLYAISIEPLTGTGQLVRHPTNPVTQILAGGQMRPISFTQREFTGPDAYVAPGLWYTLIGQEAALRWLPFMPPRVSGVTRVEIWSSTTNTTPAEVALERNLLVTFTGQEAIMMDWFPVIPAPSVPTYFQIAVFFENENEPRMFTRAVRIDPQHVDFSPYAPTIFELTAQQPGNFLGINFRAFVRPAYNAFERQLAANYPDLASLPNPPGYWFVDQNVIYYFYVTDRLDNFNNTSLTPVSSAIPAQMIQQSQQRLDPMPDGVPTRYYSLDDINQFVSIGADGVVSAPTAMVDNTVYYVRIRAERLDPDTGVSTGHLSANAYGSVYIPPVGPLHLRPQQMQAPPLRVVADLITENDFTIQWDMSWAEIFDSERNAWTTLVNVDADGNIVFGRDATGLEHDPIALHEPRFRPEGAGTQWVNDVRDVLSARGASDPMYLDTLVMRMIHLPENTEFEIHVVEFDYIDGDYEDYLLSIRDLPPGALWSPVEGPNFDDTAMTFLVQTVNAAVGGAGAVQPNTAYIVFFRPLIRQNDTLLAWWPAVLPVTTFANMPDLLIRPPTPTIEIVGEMTTDTSITVRWREYNPGFDYELSWHELLTHYPDGGIIVPLGIGDPARADLFTLPDHPGWIYYTVTGLFPSTIHHFWINATSSGITSAWSNPVNERTLDIVPPPPPTGLGLISPSSLNELNLELGTNWQSNSYVGEDPRIHYMIFEWRRVMADYLPPIPSEAPDEIPGDEFTFSGATDYEGEWLQREAFANFPTYLARVYQLQPNTRYFIRARTVLTVTRNPGGLGNGITRWYSYILQVSQDEDFLDFFEIEIPALEPPQSEVDGINSLRAMSDWTSILSFISGRDDGAFDGDINPDMFPLPDQDFEVTYDAETRTLRYRFRSDQVGADGLRDQQADQRFISRLVANRTFDFEIDMTFHRDYLIDRRVIEMPYSIYAAFNERQINLHFISNELRMTLPYGALQTAETRDLPDLGRSSTVTLTIESGPGNTPYLEHTQAYSATPQRILVRLDTPTRSVNITNFARAVPISLSLNDPGDRLLYNVNPFWSHPDIYGWQQLQSRFNEVASVFETSVYRVGTFAVLRTAAPLTERSAQGLPQIPDYFTEALYIVNTAIIIRDMVLFDPDEYINANQFNNIVLAFMSNEPGVEMNRSMTRAQHQSLGRSGLLATGVRVQQDAAIATFARLYELRTRSAIRGFSAVSVSDIDQARPQFREGILKAAHVGLFEGGVANPQEYLTFGKFIHMLAVLIEDAG
ncbi:MAG: fibronectin type III domain-containing protein [Defluviitaleaceae bacterium]|nr:fibronectin type III domain-containing protein [Defluviitaleaceae bacterium]